MFLCLLIDSFSAYASEQVSTEETNISDDNSSLLEFNPEDVNNRKGDYSALTDIYGISVFSSDFEYIETIYNEQENRRKEEIFKNVLNNEKSDNSNEQIFSLIMQAEESTFIKDNITKNTTHNSDTLITWICLSILMGLAVVIVLMEYNKRQKKRGKENEDNFDYYNI